MRLPTDSDSGLERGVNKSEIDCAKDLSITLRPPGKRTTIHWHSLGNGIAFTLLVAGPTMVSEELWRGRPMIDHQGAMWLVPTVIVMIMYFLGGATAGRRRRRPRGAVIQGVALAVSASSILVIVDIVRRVMLGNDQSIAVAELWLAALGGTIVSAVLGALFGRWLHIRKRERSSP